METQSLIRFHDIAIAQLALSDLHPEQFAQNAFNSV